MPIHPGFAPMFEMMKAMGEVDWTSAPVEQLRMIADNPMPSSEEISMARIEDLLIPVGDAELNARLYVPQGATEVPPVVAFFHGGGWVLGTLETHDSTCRVLARESGCAIVSVAYRLAPEHRYPTAVTDAFASTCWIVEHAGELGLDASRLGVAGDSAGGNLAAAVCQMAIERGGPAILHQLLIYPVIDDNISRQSYVDHGGSDSFLPVAAMQRFIDEYLGDTAFEDAPLANVLGAASLSGLPSATVIVAECDALRDEGVAYAQCLEKAGVAVRLVVAPGMIHGFFSMFPIIPEIGDTVSLAGKRLRSALS